MSAHHTPLLKDESSCEDLVLEDEGGSKESTCSGVRDRLSTPGVVSVNHKSSLMDEPSCEEDTVLQSDGGWEELIRSGM